MVEKVTWIESLNVQYFLGVDGLSAPLVFLTGLLGLCAVFASWKVNDRVKEHFFWLLVLQTAVMGVFMSLDFVLFFIFWELELVPMYFLISIWGTGRKEYSAMKFLIFTIAGSALMLIGILVLYFSTGTFDMTELGNRNLTDLLIPAQMVFLLFFVAFAIKLPVWPVHTWLPDAHTDAPTAGSVMLAGVLIKMGGYGLIRINTAMFPGITSDYSWLIVTLAVVSIMYGAMVTIRQSDLKRLIAYSSVSHMGLVLLGIASLGAAGQVSAVGLNGAAMQMFTHGTITGLLFLLVGQVYEKAHTRYIPDMGGLASRMPFLATAMIVAGLASLGLAQPQRVCIGGACVPRRFRSVVLAHGDSRVQHCADGRIHLVDDTTRDVWAGEVSLLRSWRRHFGGGYPRSAANSVDCSSGHLPCSGYGRVLLYSQSHGGGTVWISTDDSA